MGKNQNKKHIVHNCHFICLMAGKISGEIIDKLFSRFLKKIDSHVFIEKC